MRQRGFTYLGLLVMVAILGLALTAASEVWVTIADRQKTAELDWIGGQFVRAIGSYYELSPGGVRTYPATLRDLLEDKRSLTTRRHLRQVYRNPFTGLEDWEPVLASDGRLRGVRIKASPGAPFAREFIYVPVS